MIKNSRARKRWLIAIVTVVVVSAVALVVAAVLWRINKPVDVEVPSWPADRSGGEQRQLQEDDPGWYCGRDGNRVCGLSRRAL